MLCSRCGRDLPEEDFYQVKYRERTTEYRYKTCKVCTSIEQKRRNLLKTDPENPLLDKINRLYEKHREAGRQVPGESRRVSLAIESEIDEMLKW